MKVIVKIKENRKRAFERPVKTGALIGDLVSLFIFSALFGIIFQYSLIYEDLTGLVFCAPLLVVIIVDSYYSIYKPVKRLEHKVYENTSRTPPSNGEKKVL